MTNTCVGFFPGQVADRPWVVDGEVRVRKVLTMMATFDHFVVDGHELVRAAKYLSGLLDEPAKLGL